MKLFNIFSIFLVVTCRSLAKYNKRINKRNEIVFLKTKRAEVETSDECKYINSMLYKDESFNCCENERVVCENGHIIKL